jgi:uncharacterized protein DUF3995
MSTRAGTRWAAWPAYAAATWALVFALPHVYWGAGGRAGLAAAVSVELAADRSPSFRVLNWGIALFCVAGGCVALAATRDVANGAVRRFVGWLLWFGFTLLLLRVIDIVVELAFGLATFDHTPSSRAQFLRLAPWFGLLWLPWFSVGTVLFGLAALRVRSSLRRRA